MYIILFNNWIKEIIICIYRYINFIVKGFFYYSCNG